MKLKEFCDTQGWTLGFAMVRKMVSSGAITINNKVATDPEQEVKPGDTVTFGKHKSVVVK